MLSLLLPSWIVCSWLPKQLTCVHNHCHKRSSENGEQKVGFFPGAQNSSVSTAAWSLRYTSLQMPKALSYIHVIVMFAFPNDYIALYYSKFYFGDYICLPFQCNKLKQRLKTNLHLAGLGFFCLFFQIRNLGIAEL